MHTAYYIFCGTLIFIAWITYEMKAHSHRSQKSSESFWAKESQANSTKKQPIDNLPYIKVPNSLLSCPDSDNAELLKYFDRLKELSNSNILNLTGVTNTELKLLYGPANLTILTEYDQNYTELVRLLNTIGQYLIDNGDPHTGVSFLEFAIECNTDISSTYTLLAKQYLDSGCPQKIDNLIDVASKLNSLMKTSILRSLNDLLHPTVL